MLSSIAKLGGATEKFNNLAGALSAAKSAVFSNAEKVCEKPAEIEFKFTRPVSRKLADVAEVKPEETVAEEDTYADDVFFDEDTNISLLFESGRDNDLLAEWAAQGEDGTHIKEDEGHEGPAAEMPPLLLGFDKQNYFVELEYMVVEDPETGESVAPEVSVMSSSDNKSGEIYLNGNLVACVEGAQDLLAEEVVLIKVAA